MPDIVIYKLSERYQKEFGRKREDMQMIRKYRVGNPVETDAVVNKMDAMTEIMPYFTKEADGKLIYAMKSSDIVYGLGENVRGINKRGFIYESKCDDDPVHTEGRRSLYASHNFFVIAGEKPLGVFFDFAGKVSFDIGFTDMDLLTIAPENENYDCYLIEEDSILKIVKEFRGLVGRSYIPPKWAFGYGQSRWSYNDEKEVREVAQQMRENKIGIDSIYLDIDYMERYKDFTVDEHAFPNLEKLSDDLKAEGIRLVPIIDAGVKIEDGYEVYEEGVKNNYFCKDENGNDFVVGVWPGKVHLPDVLNADARKWFGNQYQFLLDKGIEGFWNDMNEPALFYSEEHLEEVFERAEELKKENLDIDSFFELMGLFGGISNNEGDYKRFYHNMNGEKVRHDRVHNLFGYNMTRAAGEAFERLQPDKRILMFSRSSYIGMHRYGGLWTGDNQSWWSHLLMNMKMLPSLNMCGFLYIGADLGGFGDHTSEDLMMRWLSLGIFTPLMRNHSAKGTRRQELYTFKHTEAFQRIIEIRYALLPYLYSEYMKAALADDMMFMPLSFVYTQDKRAAEIEDQLLVGDSLMIAPVYTQNATGRYVYLPEDMLLVRMQSGTQFETEERKAGDHYISVALDEVVFFIRKNKILPTVKPADCVDHLTDEYQYISYGKGKCDYLFYEDDGYSKDYDNQSHFTKITVSEDGSIVKEKKEVL